MNTLDKKLEKTLDKEVNIKAIFKDRDDNYVFRGVTLNKVKIISKIKQVILKEILKDEKGSLIDGTKFWDEQAIRKVFGK